MHVSHPHTEVLVFLISGFVSSLNEFVEFLCDFPKYRIYVGDKNSCICAFSQLNKSHVIIVTSKTINFATSVQNDPFSLPGAATLQSRNFDNKLILDPWTNGMISGIPLNGRDSLDSYRNSNGFFLVLDDD